MIREVNEEEDMPIQEEIKYVTFSFRGERWWEKEERSCSHTVFLFLLSRIERMVALHCKVILCFSSVDQRKGKQEEGKNRKSLRTSLFAKETDLMRSSLERCVCMRVCDGDARSRRYDVRDGRCLLRHCLRYAGLELNNKRQLDFGREKKEGVVNN